MNITIFLALLFTLQLICLLAGRRASKNLKTEKDYFLAGKEIKFFPLMMTFVATQVGGGLVLGAAEEAYLFGWPALLYPMGICFGLILLASGVGRRLAQFEVTTVAELFEVVYKSTILKKMASVLSIISLFMVLIAQVVASKKFMLSLGVEEMTLFYCCWALVIIYTVVGGLKAVVSIDIIQASFFVFVFLASFGYVVYTQNMTFNDIVATGFDSGSFDYNGSKLSGWLFMPLLFMVIEQDMAQRCFAATSPRVVSKAAICSAGVTMLISIIPVYFGILGKSSGVRLPEGASVFMTVVQSMTSPVFASFLGCAVLMAIISTAISLMNAVSSNLTQDFELSFFKGLSDLQKSRLLTAGIGIGSLIGSLFFHNVIDLLIQSYELSVYCLFVPIFGALFRPLGNKRSAVLGMVFGAFGFILFRFVSVGFPKEIICVLLSALGYGLGELLSARVLRRGVAPDVTRSYN
jgi:SSS family solute:Na+ symporter